VTPRRAVSASRWQAAGKEFEDAAAVRRSTSKRSANHRQLIHIGQQRGGRNLTRSPTRRDVWRRFRRGHGVSLVMGRDRRLSRADE
jgi:hypothetical protein